MATKVIEGDFRANSSKVAIVVSRWNSFITERLKDGALEMLKRHGFDQQSVDVVYCPGSFELPLAAKLALDSGRYDGVICLGVVIRGATSHYDHVCSAVTSGVARLNLDYGKPVVFGLVTTDTMEQAMERAGIKAGNKGEEAALVFLEMTSLATKFA